MVPRLELFVLLLTAVASTSQSACAGNDDETSLLASQMHLSSQEAMIQKVLERAKTELYAYFEKRIETLEAKLSRDRVTDSAIMDVVSAFEVTGTSITIRPGKDLHIRDSNLLVYSMNAKANGKGNLIVGLYHNYSAASNGFVAGTNNTIVGHASSVTGGELNEATSLAVVGGGQGNSASGTCSFVAAGFYNKATGRGSAIISGYNNTAAGQSSFAASGENNIAHGTAAVAIAGSGNALYGTGSVGITGSKNSASLLAYGSVVLGGNSNKATNMGELLAMGAGNEAAGIDGITIGGASNAATGRGGITIGGADNEADGNGAITIAGASNNATGQGGTAIGGEYSNAKGSGSTVISGSYLSSAGSGSVALGGTNNTAAGSDSVIVGGENGIAEVDNSVTAANIYLNTWAGSCQNGQLRPQAERTADSQCGSCDAGYDLSGTVCQAWAGSCQNGQLRAQAKRTADNQCSYCWAGYELSGTVCQEACVDISGIWIWRGEATWGKTPWTKKPRPRNEREVILTQRGCSGRAEGDFSIIGDRDFFRYSVAGNVANMMLDIIGTFSNTGIVAGRIVWSNGDICWRVGPSPFLP